MKEIKYNLDEENKEDTTHNKTYKPPLFTKDFFDTLIKNDNRNFSNNGPNLNNLEADNENNQTNSQQTV
jgi:hypothetical protein